MSFVLCGFFLSSAFIFNSVFIFLWAAFVSFVSCVFVIVVKRWVDVHFVQNDRYINMFTLNCSRGRNNLAFVDQTHIIIRNQS